ncbi:unnamed protein product [Urochloa decumbens]|uniref:Uncharacterized protein n=1 Tax=Urochloa decumbens TaxID=240449 RepID=A0ABC8YE35_9POAL
MAAAAAAAAAAPPLFPTPLKASAPASLSIPAPASTCRFAASPDYLTPSARRVSASPLSPAPWTRRLAPSPASPSPAVSKNPGRESASRSWVLDKAARAGVAPPSPVQTTSGSKIPGRASLSNSWVRDKVAGTTPPDTPASSDCSKRSFTPSPSENCTGKEQRYESPSTTPIPSSDSDSEDSDYDSESEFYNKPAFVVKAPPAHRLPMPCFLTVEMFEFWVRI